LYGAETEYLYIVYNNLLVEQRERERERESRSYSVKATDYKQQISPPIPDQISSVTHPNTDVLDTRSYFSEGKMVDT